MLSHSDSSRHQPLKRRALAIGSAVVLPFLVALALPADAQRGGGGHGGGGGSRGGGGPSGGGVSAPRGAPGGGSGGGSYSAPRAAPGGGSRGGGYSAPRSAPGGGSRGGYGPVPRGGGAYSPRGGGVSRSAPSYRPTGRSWVNPRGNTYRGYGGSYRGGAVPPGTRHAPSHGGGWGYHRGGHGYHGGGHGVYWRPYPGYGYGWGWGYGSYPWYGWAGWWWGGPWWGWGWGWWPTTTVLYDDTATPAPRGAWGVVKTDITPEEAEVWLDGTYVGTADDFDGYPDYLYLRPGAYKLEFRLANYQTMALDIQIADGENLRFDRKMQIEPGKSALDSFPPEGKAMPYGRFFGPGGAPVSATVRLQDEEGIGIDDPRGRTALREERPPRDTALRGDRGRLRFSVTPEDAAIYVDDKYVGVGDELNGSPRGVIVDAGKRAVTVTRPGFKTKTVEVEAKVGQPIDVVVDLEKQ